MARQLNLDKDAIANRMTLFLPANFAKDNSSNIWKLLRSMAEIFHIVTEGLDELYKQTNIETASGEYLDEYVRELTNIGRDDSETDDDLLVRYYRNVFTYNGTRDGMRQIVYDIMGSYPTALVDNQPGGFSDALFYFNDIAGGSSWGNDSGQPFVGYIFLKYAPSEEQLDKLCNLINIHKALGVKIYLKYRRYQIFNGLSYTEIAEAVTEQSVVKQVQAPYGDFYDGNGYYNDTNYPAIYGDEDDVSDTKYLFLKERPDDGVLDELLEQLAENLEAGDTLKVVFPEDE